MATGKNDIFVDNCLAHGDIPYLKAIRMVLLPPNTTSMSQPMDQGVMHYTRNIYCHHLLKRMLLCYDNSKGYSIDVHRAICLIVRGRSFQFLFFRNSAHFFRCLFQSAVFHFFFFSVNIFPSKVNY